MNSVFSPQVPFSEKFFPTRIQFSPSMTMGKYVGRCAMSENNPNIEGATDALLIGLSCGLLSEAIEKLTILMDWSQHEQSVTLPSFLPEDFSDPVTDAMAKALSGLKSELQNPNEFSKYRVLIGTDPIIASHLQNVLFQRTEVLDDYILDIVSTTHLRMAKKIVLALIPNQQVTGGPDQRGIGYLRCVLPTLDDGGATGMISFMHEFVVEQTSIAVIDVNIEEWCLTLQPSTTQLFSQR